MSKPEILKVRTTDFKEVELIDFNLIELTSGQRIARACKTLGVFWGLATFCILIPILHFVLVPLFFILGPILSSKYYRQLNHLVSAKFNCPECQSSVDLKTIFYTEKYQLRCENCATQLTLFKA